MQLPPLNTFFVVLAATLWTQLFLISPTARTKQGGWVMPIASPLPAPHSHPLPGQPCTSRLPPSLWGMGGAAPPPFFFGSALGAGLNFPCPTPVCAGSWENAEINKYTIRQASSWGGWGGVCCKKRLRPNFGMPEKAAGAVGKRGVVGFPPPLSSRRRRGSCGPRGGRKVAASSLVLGRVSPLRHLAESRTRHVCAGGVMRAGGLSQPSACSCHGSRANSAGVFGAESRGVLSVQAATRFGVNK